MGLYKYNEAKRSQMCISKDNVTWYSSERNAVEMEWQT